MIRKIRGKDLKSVKDLVNETFKPLESMDTLFPHLFITNEKFSYVQEVDHQIISFVGVSPILYGNLKGVSIGAVCTKEKFQGQGLMREMFPFVLTDLKKQGIDFVLISGAGKVYRENGAEDFGSFKKYVIDQKLEHSDLLMFKYNQDIKGLTTIYNTMIMSDSFTMGINELAIALESQAIARLKGFEPVTYYLKSGTFLTYAYSQNIAEVIEWGGNLNEVLAIIERLNYEYSISSTALIVKDSVKIEIDYSYERIINAGTIIKVNKAVNFDDLPFCSGYKFI